MPATIMVGNEMLFVVGCLLKSGGRVGPLLAKSFNGVIALIKCKLVQSKSLKLA